MRRNLYDIVAISVAHGAEVGRKKDDGPSQASFNLVGFPFTSKKRSCRGAVWPAQVNGPAVSAEYTFAGLTGTAATDARCISLAYMQ